MKRFFILLCTILLLSCVKQEAIDEMDMLLLSGKYSQAKSSFDKYQHRLNRQDYLFFTGVFRNLSLDHKSSIYYLSELLNKCGDQLSDSLTVRVLKYQLENYLQSGYWEKAKETDRILKQKYSAYCDSLEISNWQDRQIDEN